MLLHLHCHSVAASGKGGRKGARSNATLWQRPEGAGWGPDQNLRILSNSQKFTERLCIIEVAAKSSRPARH